MGRAHTQFVHASTQHICAQPLTEVQRYGASNVVMLHMLLLDKQ